MFDSTNITTPYRGVMCVMYGVCVFSTYCGKGNRP